MSALLRDALVRAAALLLFAAVACKPPPPPAAPPPPAVAVVDGAPIALPVLQRELDRVRRDSPSSLEDVSPAFDAGPVDPAEVGKLGRALLEPLIDRQLLAARAKAAGIAVSDAEVQRATEALAESARAAGFGFSDHLAQDDQTQEQLHDETRERLLAERWVAQQLKPAAPTPGEVKQYFESHRSELDVPEEVHALQIVVSSAAEAKSVLDQVRRGIPFEELARSHSQSPDARRGGDLGFFRRGTMPQVFDETCFSLKPGQVSGVVPSRYGFHLFKLLERRAARRHTLEEVRPEVERRLVAESRIAAERALLSGLRAKAQVQVDTAVLAQLH